MNAQIVIVEDDEISSYILMESFKQIGLTSIHSFNNTVEFIKYLRADSTVIPKVIVMDYDMPVMTGFQLLAYLKRNSILTGIKVIFYSGSADESHKRTCLKAGALDFVEKNYTHKALRTFALKVQQLAETGSYQFN